MNEHAPVVAFSDAQRGRVPSRYVKVLTELGDSAAPGPEWIREQRQALGLSIRGLALRLGCQPARVSEWERGRAVVPPALRGALRRELSGVKARTASRDAEVLELVSREPGLSLSQLLERFPAHDVSAVRGALQRHVWAGSLFRAKGVIEDRSRRPRIVWLYYPEAHNGEPVREVTGADLRKARRRRGWSQETLGAALGVSREAVRAWEDRGDQPIPPARVRGVYAVLRDRKAPNHRPRKPTAIPDLRARRRSLGLTQPELADRLGLRHGQGAVSAWERARTSISDATAARIHKVLEAVEAERVTPADLRAGRNRAGWTQNECAERLGVNVGRLRRWEQERMTIPAGFWPTIGEVLAAAPAAEHGQPELQRATGTTAPDRTAGRQAAIAALVSAEPGLSPRRAMERVGASWDTVRSDLATLKAERRIHQRETRYLDGAGRTRSRPGLYPGAAEPAASVATPPGEQIVRRREWLGWSQAELSRRLGLSPAIVHRWERGDVAPVTEQAVQLEQIFAAGERELTGEDAERLARVEELLAPMRARLGFSITEMASRLRVDRGTYAAWEAGKHPVSSRRRRELLAALDQLAPGRSSDRGAPNRI